MRVWDLLAVARQLLASQNPLEFDLLSSRPIHVARDLENLFLVEFAENGIMERVPSQPFAYFRQNRTMFGAQESSKPLARNFIRERCAHSPAGAYFPKRYMNPSMGSEVVRISAICTGRQERTAEAGWKRTKIADKIAPNESSLSVLQRISAQLPASYAY